jgi:hypothetical protein
MAKNKVQFQNGYSLFEFMQDYGTEKQCEQALMAWPVSRRRSRQTANTSALSPVANSSFWTIMPSTGLTP